MTHQRSERATQAGAVAPHRLPVPADDLSPEALLALVTDVTRVLLTTEDVDAGITRAIALIGEALQIMRVCVVQSVAASRPDEVDSWPIAHEWSAPGSTSRRGSPSEGGAHPSGAFSERSRRGRPFEHRIGDGPDGFVAGQASIGTAATLTVPIIVRSAEWGLLTVHAHGVDNAWTEGQKSMLKTVASCIAAAVERDAIQQERRLIEQTRWRKLGVANESLRRVAQSLRPGATLKDILATVLRESATVCGSSVGGIFLRSAADDSVRLVVSCVAGGDCIASTPNDEAPWFQALPTDLTTRWVGALLGEQVVSMDRSEAQRTQASPLAMSWGHCSEFDFEIDLPLVAGDELVGVLTQLFPTREAAKHFDFLHARALAHMAALAIHQDRMATRVQQSLLEAERRRAERERLNEVMRAHRLLRQATSALAEATDDTQMFSGCLATIVEQAGAEAVWLFRNEKDDGIMRLVGSLRNGRFSPTGEASDPAHFRKGLDIRGYHRLRALMKDQLVWRSLRSPVNKSAYPPATYEWHMRQGHAANAVQILSVGARVVGFLGMVFRDSEPPSHSQRQHIQSLTQLVALTLELKRQAHAAQQHAEQTAVTAERTRLAREVHDNIAQSFLGIQLQLQQVPGRVRRRVGLDGVIALAANGLTEARRAVAALRPNELLHHGLPLAVERLVQQMTHGQMLHATVEHSARWEPLPSAVEDHVFRIVQEAVTNVLRHAQATQLRVELSQTAEATTVLVSDDGVGFNPEYQADDGFGRESIRQRAALIGGQAAWLSEPGRGTQMLVSWSR